MESKEKTEKYREIEPLEFKEEDVPVVCYDETVIGDCDEQTIRNYMNLHVKEHPEVSGNIDDGEHTFEKCRRYIMEMVRKWKDKEKGDVMMVSSDRVFRLAVNFYMSPVVEKERKIVESKPAVSDWNSPEAVARREEAERKRREEELEKKREADIRKNGLSLFDF